MGVSVDRMTRGRLAVPKTRLREGAVYVLQRDLCQGAREAQLTAGMSHERLAHGTRCHHGELDFALLAERHALHRTQLRARGLLEGTVTGTELAAVIEMERAGTRKRSGKMTSHGVRSDEFSFEFERE